MNELLPTAVNARTLEQTEVSIWTQHQDAVLKLECKYKRLINDLIDEKMMIQQKLQQSLQDQLKHLFQLKLSLLRENQETQECQEQENTITCQFVKLEPTTETDSQLENFKENHIAWNKCNMSDCNNETNCTRSNSIDIPLIVKDEPSIESINVDNSIRVDVLNNINDDHESDESQPVTTIAPKFDINKTQARMEKQIGNHITNIKNPKNGAKFECNHCKKKFTRLNKAQDHVGRNHIDEKPFKCNECDKCFALWRHLSRHENIHSTKYQCTFCGRKCGSSNDLQEHERKHTGEKPCKCQYDGCGKSFRTTSGLIQHKRVHSGEKPFECDICHKRLCSSQYLRQHKITQHSNSKQYKCNYNKCGKCYALKSQLILHKNIHTPKYQCPFCYKRHRCEYELKKHMQNHSNKD